MHFRHEWKHQINYADLLALRSRLSAVLRPDSHAVNGRYVVRSLYFDNLEDKALREKLDGVNCREKFRIRYYNGDTSLLLLEKKSKVNGLCNKVQARLTLEEAREIADGSFGFGKMRERGFFRTELAEREFAKADMKSMEETPMEEGSMKAAENLLWELYSKMNSQGLRAKTIVDYTREAFVYAPGNVRITLDYDIRTGMNCTDFLNPDCVTVPIRDAPVILEVKWDAYLPSVIRDAVQTPTTHVEAFSKYAACRAYG